MRKLTAAALVAGTAGALAYRPSRETIGDVLITVGGHLAYGPPPERTPAADAKAHARIMAAVRERERPHANGHKPVI